MFDKFLNTEIAYTKKFAEYYEDNEIIRFRDTKIPDMYSHNFTLLKYRVSKERLEYIISEEIEKRKAENADFLRVEFSFPIEEDYIGGLPIAPEVTRYDYMYIEPQAGDYLPEREGCAIVKAVSEIVLNHGIDVDIIANELLMGMDFASRRIYRKAEIYGQQDSNLDLYVCYYDGIPVGNCELLLNEDIAKIEDFDILPGYQRRGFGTCVLKHLLREAKDNGVEFAYLITGSGDTAKEMYKKCGFRKAGEKTELFFRLTQQAPD